MSFEISYQEVSGLKLRVGRTSPEGAGPVPLVLFNGIGASLEILESFAGQLEQVRTISFDMPGVGGSELAWLPRRPSGLARLAKELLDQLGEGEVDVLGVSWGGMLAQQFALQYPRRTRRLILAATSSGQLMVPASPRVLLHMMTPFRYSSAGYFRQVAGTIYGGDFRNDKELVRHHGRLMAPPTPASYLQQLFAISGWTSLFWLHRLRQPTLVLAGDDDPIVPRMNARIPRERHTRRSAPVLRLWPPVHADPDRPGGRNRARLRGLEQPRVSCYCADQRCRASASSRSASSSRPSRRSTMEYPRCRLGVSAPSSIARA